MDTKFNFNSQVCTSRFQSEKLLALGLKKETADMVWLNLGKKKNVWTCKVCIDCTPVYVENRSIPAWSLHRLIELIWGDGEHDMSIETHRPFEDCIERIDYMINQSCCFNKEYLV